MDPIIKLISICLQEIKLADETDDLHYKSEIGLGIRAYSRYLRLGIKAILDLQEENVKLKDQLQSLEESDINE